jgi:VanZ family protein
MLAIFAASAQSSLPDLPGQPSDKSEHGAAYAILSLLLVRALTRGSWARVTFRTVLAATAVCAAYGWSDEFHQRFVPDRTYDLMDLAADTAGAAAAAGAAWAWGIILRGRGPTHDR